MNELQVFNNDLFGEIRFVEVEGKPYAVANDVAKALGYKNPTDAVNTKCMNIVKHEVENSRGQMRMTNVIPEGDIYRLIIGSKLPSAEKFERWVFDEVLPQIRKTGGYIPVTKEQKRDSYMIEDPIERAYAWIEERKERDRLEAENEKLLNVIEEQEDTIDSLKAVGISEPYNVQSMCQHLPGKPYPNEVYNKLIELGWLCKTNVATYNVTTKGRNKIYKHGRGICFYIKGWNEFKNCLKSRNKNQ